MQRTFNKILIILLISILGFCNSCTSLTPPLELAPNREIIAKGIYLQLQQTHNFISNNLQIKSPKLEITEINVTKIEPFFIHSLPVYHLKGTYKLNLQLTKKEIKQNLKFFDLYLQRQKEGKTWHLIRHQNQNNSLKWFSYKIN